MEKYLITLSFLLGFCDDLKAMECSAVLTTSPELTLELIIQNNCPTGMRTRDLQLRKHAIKQAMPQRTTNNVELFTKHKTLS